MKYEKMEMNNNIVLFPDFPKKAKGLSSHHTVWSVVWYDKHMNKKKKTLQHAKEEVFILDLYQQF